MVNAQQSKLDQLRILTENLPPFPSESDSGTYIDRFKQYEIEQGTSLSWSLLSLQEVSCAKWFNSQNTVFPLHAHEEREWIIVYSGSMILTIEDNKPKRLLSGMSVMIEPNTLHKANFPEDCWCIAITIPKSESWPE